MTSFRFHSKPASIFVICLFQNLLVFIYLFLQCATEPELQLVNVVSKILK